MAANQSFETKMSGMQQDRRSGWDAEFIESLWRDPIQNPLTALLVRDMCMVADDEGRAASEIIATRFRNFFRKRREEQKTPIGQAMAERLKIPADLLADQSVEWWQQQIAEVGCSAELFQCASGSIRWNGNVWSRWSPGFKKALRNVAETKLIEYFEKAGIGY